jgi:hypothetical protein
MRQSPAKEDVNMEAEESPTLKQPVKTQQMEKT